MSTGQEYANSVSATGGQIDAPTFYGMRVAMFEAVKAWHSPDVQHNRDTALRLIRQACQDSRYLRAAGTSEVVSRYFENAINHPDADVMAFLNAITPADVERMDRARIDGSPIDLVLSAAVFSSAASEHLNIPIMTDSFRNYLRQNGTSLAGVPVERGVLTPDDAEEISRMDRMFRLADALDDAASLVGMGSPAVAQHIAPFNPNAYTQTAVDALRDAPPLPVTTVRLQMALERNDFATDVGGADGMVDGVRGRRTEEAISAAKGVLVREGVIETSELDTLSDQRLHGLLSDRADRARGPRGG